jgi:hypothetical protein
MTTRSNKAREEQAHRRRATAAGQTAERLVALALDKAAGLSLWALEQAATVQPESDRLRTAERRLTRLRSAVDPLPRLSGRLIAGSTYFGTRLAPEVARAAREITSETTAFMRAQSEAPDD